MNKYKIVWIEGGAVGNRCVDIVEAENPHQAMYLFKMKMGYGSAIESVSLVEEEND